ncbi:hypothetical protein TcBrA4_0066270 [Trypanosoma cruzi]|nr:hypothetical protein TcBrA4_0066270 [Trypanosoma cruzi]
MKSDVPMLSRHQKVSHLMRLRAAKATGHPKPYPPPPIPTPNNYGRARQHPTAAASGTGACPDEIDGEALRHLGRAAKRAVPRLFNRRLRAGTVPRNRRRVVVIPLLCNPGKTASDRDPTDLQ